MNANSIYTRRRFGIDINVLLVMLCVVVLCAGLLSYSLIGNKICIPFKIGVKGYNNQKNSSFTQGETVMLTAYLPIGSDPMWDFGDGTPTLNGLNPIHIYLKTGRFTITATENGLCNQTINITIKAKPADPHPEILVAEPISGNLSPIAGIEEKYTCNVKANAYEWSVSSSSNFETKFGVTASYQFPLPGTYELQVKLDDNPSRIFTTQIVVLPAAKPKPSDIPVLIHPVQPVHQPQTDNNPPPPKKDDTPPPVIPKEDNTPTEEKGKSKLIGNDAFKAMLEDVVRNDKDNVVALADFLPYLYYGTATKVFENGKRSPIDFSQLCEQLRGKKIEIKSVILNREENKNVQNIEINFKKKNNFIIF